MEDNTDAFDEEFEELEEEEAEEELKPKKKAVKKVKSGSEKPTERYLPFHQVERLGIIDTLTNEIIVDGLKDIAEAKLEAYKLNQLDKIGIATGTND